MNNRPVGGRSSKTVSHNRHEQQFTISKLLVGDYLLLMGFGPYGITFMDVCAVITVAMVMLLEL
jgi:hypothetical protein